MTNRKLRGLLIDTKIDDLGWPWTAISSNFRRISRDFTDLGGRQQQITHEDSDRVVTGWMYGVFQKKIAQSLRHHNFATVHHRVTPFSAKCSERTCLHDKGQCLNMAIKYSLLFSVIQWQVNYVKTKQSTWWHITFRFHIGIIIRDRFGC